MTRTGVTYSRLAGHHNTRTPRRGAIGKVAIHGIVFVSHDYQALRIPEKAQRRPYRVTGELDGTFF